MKEGYHPCKAEGCARSVKDSYGMCRPHWAMVPRPLQTLIWNSEGVKRHRYLVEAIAAVKAKEEARQPKLPEDNS